METIQNNLNSTLVEGRVESVVKRGKMPLSGTDKEIAQAHLKLVRYVKDKDGSYIPSYLHLSILMLDSLAKMMRVEEGAQMRVVGRLIQIDDALHIYAEHIEVKAPRGDNDESN